MSEEPRWMTRIEQLAEVSGPVALAIGVFDGLHRGHQEVLKAAVEHAHQHQGTAVAMTFDPHPKEILSPDRAPKRLTPLQHQQVVLEDLGVDHLLVCRFDLAFAATPAADFVERLVKAARPLGCVSVGYGWSFGKGREGNVHFLMDEGSRADFAVYGVPPVRLGDEIVSSTWVRRAVEEGDLDTVADLLGRPFSMFGTVVEGRQLGRQLGFPTANVAWVGGITPPAGVYACEARWEGAWVPAVVNLGRRPTVDESGLLSLEVHLLDWEGDLYGKQLEVRFRERLRGERQFDGVEALRTQIDQDVIAARQVFA